MDEQKENQTDDYGITPPSIGTARKVIRTYQQDLARFGDKAKPQNEAENKKPNEKPEHKVRKSEPEESNRAPKVIKENIVVPSAPKPKIQTRPQPEKNRRSHVPMPRTSEPAPEKTFVRKFDNDNDIKARIEQLKKEIGAELKDREAPKTPQQLPENRPEAPLHTPEKSAPMPEPKPMPVSPAKPPVTPMHSPAPPKNTEATTLDTNTGPSPIHTYKSDASNYSKKEALSPLAVLAREQDSKTSFAPEKKEKKSNIFMFAIGILVLVLGAGLAIGAYIFTKEKPVAVAPKVVSPIFVNEQVRLPMKDYLSGLATLEQTDIDNGSITQVYGSTLIEGGGEEFLQLSDTMSSVGAPRLLTRSILSGGMVGMYGNKSKDTPDIFFVVPVSSYERAFKAMLDWENSGLLADIAKIYKPIVAVGSTGASSTTPFVPQFSDVVFQNTDTREVLDANGNTYLIYGFLNPNLLVIATSKDAFAEILNRYTIRN